MFLRENLFSSVVMAVSRNLLRKSDKIAVTQEKNRSNREFSQRTDGLARRLGVPLNDLEGSTGISSRMLYAYRKDGYPITRKAWAKLEAAEAVAGIAVSREKSQQQSMSSSAKSDAGHRGITGSDPPKSGDIPAASRMMFAPGFHPKPAEPTAENCVAHLQAYLNKIQDAPGGVPHTWVQLQLHLPLEQAERMAALLKKI